MRINRYDTYEDANAGMEEIEKGGGKILDVKIIVMMHQNPVNGSMIQQPVFFVTYQKGLILNK